MKIIGFIMGNKILMAVVVIALVVMLYLFSTGTSLTNIFGGEETGTVLSVVIEKADGTKYSAVVYLDDSLTLSIFDDFSTPMTTYTTEVPPLEPLGLYTITFAVTTSITNAADISTITSEKVEITNTFGYIAGGYLYNAAGTLAVSDTKTDLSPTVPNTFTPATFTQYKYDTGDIMQIKGKHINNSTFDLKITVNALDSNGYPTSKVIEADILLNVLAPTDLNVVIDNIGVTT